ncbi:MAG: Gfo/Idh/MocA family oxidoreductase [Spirochaetaceae bacterium]|nr:MAG: Gfo/Idh/MocA family oxidoreductase [Spirochaetaceae bacterium]
MNQIGIGIVGAGKAGSNFTRALQSLSEQARVIGFCTAHGETAREAARRFEVELGTDNLPELLGSPDVDAVIVASPDRFHCPQVIAAAESGKHVLCEKPMARNAEEAERMIAACRDNGVILMVGFTDRFNQPCLEAKRRIEAGEIGSPRMILARRCHPRSVVRGRKWLNDRETEGVLSYAGTHNIDLICWYMGGTPERVHGEMGQLILTGQDFTDCAVMTFKFPDGGIAVLYETFAYPDNYPHGVDRSLEILGERGVIKIDLMSQPLHIHTAAGFSLADSLTWPQGSRGLEGALRAEVEHFLDCIRQGSTPITGGEEGRLAIRIAAAARRASESGRAVRL